MGVSSLPKTVTRQRRDCNLNPGLLRLSPARYHSAIEQPPCTNGQNVKYVIGLSKVITTIGLQAYTDYD